MARRAHRLVCAALLEQEIAGPGDAQIAVLLNEPLRLFRSQLRRVIGVDGNGFCRSPCMKRQRLVLVADDYEDAAELLAELLSLEFGCPTVWVKDGAEALAVGLARKPLAALLDIDMPRMKGTEVARKLREQRGKTILLVAITGRIEVESLRPLRLFDLVFQKPLTDEDRAEIERHIDALLDG